MSLAAFKINKYIGSGAATNISGIADSSVCYTTSDTDVRPASVSSYFLGVPTGVVCNYSYENWLKLECITKPNNSVSGIKIWSSDLNGSNQSGVYMMMGVSTSGMTPVNTSGVKCTGVAGYVSGWAVQYYGASNALAWTRSGSPTTTITGIGDTTDFLVTQLKITSDATVNTGPKFMILVISYDES
jgi:hypothetical protein